MTAEDSALRDKKVHWLAGTLMSRRVQRTVECRVC